MRGGGLSWSFNYFPLIVEGYKQGFTATIYTEGDNVMVTYLSHYDSLVRCLSNDAEPDNVKHL